MPLLGLVILACGAAEPSFRLEVQPMLVRAGCSSGPCHGNLNGKGGFKLSLRGEDPSFDLRAILRGATGRRVSSLDPAESLLLKKASGAVPHEGGVRLNPDTFGHKLLARWIEAGCPDDTAKAPAVTRLEVSPGEQFVRPGIDKVTLKVTALLADGTRRDVGALATFEPATQALVTHSAPVVEANRRGAGSVLVSYAGAQAVARLHFLDHEPLPVAEAAHPVDRLVQGRLARAGEKTAPPVPDHVFLRRVWFDLAGTPPPVEVSRAFLADKSPDKRARQIDALLEGPAFAEVMALKWADILRVEEKTLDARGVAAMHGWLRRAFLDRMPLDAMARELISGRGSTYAHPPANFYRALRDEQARAEAVGQVFLGLRLQCAKCHNHPFDRWKQDDYHSFASLFSRVRYQILSNDKRDMLDKHEFNGEQIVYMARSGEYKHPGGGLVAPRILDLAGAVPESADPLVVLAEWVGSAANPYFAKAQANRLWRHLMGRGLVDPEDDFRLANPPSNPELLDFLTAELVRGGFEARSVLRLIATSQAYQRSWTNDDDEEDDGLASSSRPRPLPAEQVLDALSQVTGSPLQLKGWPKGTRAQELPGVLATREGGRRPGSNVDRFLRVFGKPERLLSCDCERSSEPTLAQTFQLLTGDLLQEMLARSDNRLAGLVSAPLDKAVEELYLAVLARRPSTGEAEGAARIVSSARSRREGLEDLLWGLVNSREFLLRW
jgi:hypothetical protein